MAFVKSIVVLSLIALATARPQNPKDVDAKVLSSSFDEDPGKSYAFSLETDNGIKLNQAAEILPGPTEDEGSQNVQGSYSFVADDGQEYTVFYTAGEQGFAPEGAHLPTPPPTPQHVVELLNQLGL